MEKQRHLQNTDFSDKIKKRELLYVLDRLKWKIPKRVDIMTKERGQEGFRLAPYHIDLNPAEMVWSYLKRQLGEEKFDPNIQNMKGNAENKSDMRRSYVMHVK